MKSFLPNTNERNVSSKVESQFRRDEMGGPGYTTRGERPEKRELHPIMQSSETFKQPFTMKGKVSKKMKNSPIYAVKKQKKQTTPKRERYNNNAL